MAFPEMRHPAYDHIDAQKAMGARNGTQAGDPIKGAKAMYELAIIKDPPLRVVIGSYFPAHSLFAPAGWEPQNIVSGLQCSLLRGKY